MSRNDGNVTYLHSHRSLLDGDLPLPVEGASRGGCRDRGLSGRDSRRTQFWCQFRARDQHAAPSADVNSGATT